MGTEQVKPIESSALAAELDRLQGLVADARAADFKNNQDLWQRLHVACRDELERLVVTVRAMQPFNRRRTRK